VVVPSGIHVNCHPSQVVHVFGGPMPVAQK
jgi:hypothetical protein